MAEAAHRPFAPSARRLGLARRAGLTAASPHVVAAAAWAAAAIALAAVARATAAALGAWIATACAGADGEQLRLAAAAGGGRLAAAAAAGGGRLAAAAAAGGGRFAAAGGGGRLAAAAGGGRLAAAGGGGRLAAADGGGGLLPADLARAVLGLALPALLAVAGAALVAHLAQTRSPWLPRRTVAGAPALDRGAGARGAITARELAFGVAIGGIAFGWLWTLAPRLARLPELAPRDALAASAALVASFIAAVAVAWVAIGALDAIARAAELAGAVRMTDAERREDARLAAADPRWRARRQAAARGPSAADAVASAAVLLLGDDAAVAIAWDARLRPVPARVAIGRGPRATQLLGLARRYRVPVHRDARLAAALAPSEGPVPDAEWARLAEIVAAVRPPG